MTAAGFHRIALGLLTTVLATLSAAAEEVTADPPPLEEVVRAYVEIWNTGSVEDLDRWVAEDVERHAAVGRASSLEELARAIRGIHGFYGDPEFRIEDLVVGGDEGMARLSFRGRYGDTGFDMKARSLNYFHFREGRIAAEWVQGNTLDLWTSFGYRLSPPEAVLVPPPVEEPPSERRTPIDRSRLDAWIRSAEDEAKASAARVTVRTDVDAVLRLDGRPIGALPAGESVSFPVSRGSHVVHALSLGGAVFQEEALDLGRRDSAVLELREPPGLIVRPRSRTAEDLSTGLMWHMTDNGANVDWVQAEQWCSESRLGNYEDWRLPTLFELRTVAAEETEKRYDTRNGIVLTDCCPWTTTRHGPYVWTHVFHMGVPYLQVPQLPWHSRALCVRDVVPVAVAGR